MDPVNFLWIESVNETGHNPTRINFIWVNMGWVDMHKITGHNPTHPT